MVAVVPCADKRSAPNMATTMAIEACSKQRNTKLNLRDIRIFPLYG